MNLVYAWAEVKWLSLEEDGIERPIQGRVIAPSVFNTDESQWWSLFLFLKNPVCPGETVTLPITTMIEEVAESVLQPGASFELKRGPKSVAYGSIISAEQVSREQYDSLFQFNGQMK